MKRMDIISSWVRCLIIVFLLIVSLSTLLLKAAHGEEAKVQILTLEEALQITAEKNRDIQKALEYRNLVKAIYVTERAAALPQFVISAYAVNSRDESQKAFGFGFPLRTNTRSAEIALYQSLFTW